MFHCSTLKPFQGSPNQMEGLQLPTDFLNDQPLVFPLAILDYRRASPKAPWEVLMQWHGLSPDETSWEDWTQLCRNYHLEDKVVLQGSKDDRNSETIVGVRVKIANQGVQEEAKPKRKVAKPSYLNDYV